MSVIFMKHDLAKIQRGFSLVELMVGIALGLIVLAAMVSLFASSSESHRELEKSSRQVENGRFSVEMLREEIQLAAFYGDYMPGQATTWTLPDPCATALNNMGFSGATSPVSLPTGIFGYDGSQTLTSSCNTLLAHRKPGTDVLVVRRVGTEEVVIDLDENDSIDSGAAVAAGAYYLQVSNCSDLPSEVPFLLANTLNSFTSLHKVKPAGNPASCKNGGLSPVRQYVVRVFFVDGCNNCTGSGDGIPTLKMAELAANGGFELRALAEGIDNLQIEYGVDTNSDGIADTYVTAANVEPTPPVTPTNWSNVVSARFFVLARNTETTPGYQDTKKYILDSAGDPTTALGPYADGFKRHVFSVTARANNVAGRRQQ